LSRRRARAALLTVLVVAGCSGYRIVRDDKLNAPAADRVEDRLVKVRGLPFKRAVPIVTVSAGEARGLLEREIRREYDPPELAALSKIYAALGLLPAGTDLEKTMLQLYGSEVAGFYDPIDHRMVLVADALHGDLRMRILGAILRRDLTGELVLAHELTHALQDQHFGLNIGRGDLGDDDAELARRAVYEGDATLAGFAAVMGKLGRGAARALAGQLSGLPEQIAKSYPDMPALIRDTLIFQYVNGVDFVSWAYEHAGWDGVNAVLTRPPRSTEQILHPEKYFQKPEYPLAVRIGAIAPFINEGWELSEDATLGELVIEILMERFFDSARARTVAAGWDGDRLVALTKGVQTGLIWMTAWDTERDATEFESAYREVLSRKLGGTAQPEAAPKAPVGEQPYYLERRGTQVLTIEGPLQPDLDALAEQVWRRTTFEPVMPWVPIDLAGSTGGLAATVQAH
jgi:hypothetical protein